MRLLGCQEICGDGLNLGFTYENDDGNRKNGEIAVQRLVSSKMGIIIVIL